MEGRKEEKLDEQTKLNITLASNSEGWDTAVNGQLLRELANNPRVRVSGLVPKSNEKQRAHAKKLGIELVDTKDIPGLAPAELLAYPPDSLEIDILIIHSYGRDLGRQAQVIKEAKKCKWVHVLHTVSEELIEFLENGTEHDSEHEIQVALCQQADAVIAIGPKVADTYRSALHFCGKDKDLIDLTPGIFHNFIGVRPSEQKRETFHVLLSGSLKFFKVKGCDIAARAIKLLNKTSCGYHLIFVVKPSQDVAKATEALLSEGLTPDQFTVRGSGEDWIKLLSEVDLAVKPSRIEGFGMNGVRAISADLPVLVSGKIGLGIALKKLPSGVKHVVDSEDPQAWADKIKEVKEKDTQTRHSQAEELRREYTTQFNWKQQCDELVTKMFAMIPSKHGV